MFKFHQIISALVVISMTSCTSTTDRPHEVITIDFDQCVGNSLNDIGFKIESTEFIPLETTDSSLVGNVSTLMCEDECWYVESNHSYLYRFDNKGRFLNSIGHRGSGPGEYINIKTFGIANGKIYVISSNQNKVCVYTPQGEWIEDITDVGCLKFANTLTALGSGNFLVSNSICFKDDIPLFGLWNSGNPQEMKPVENTAYTYSGAYQWALNPITVDKGEIYTLSPLSSVINHYEGSSSTMTPMYSIIGLYSVNPITQGDYSEAFKGSLKDKSNIAMALTVTNDFLIVATTGQNLIWNRNTRKGALMEKQTVSDSKNCHLFSPLSILYNDDSTVASICSAETVESYCTKNNINLPFVITEESNPIILRHKIK